MDHTSNSARFEISAAVVFRLGEELITDVVQALVELVKNSYDADATHATVRITTPDPDGNQKGAISVTDDGHGMTESEFKRGWLMIAESSKKKLKDAGKSTARGRTPVGDKGLGRLGVQRLGHDVEIRTRSKSLPDTELRLSFSWRHFESAVRLSEVPVQLEHHPCTGLAPGTTITVRDLKDPDQWKGELARTALQKSLSELISPFREVRDFNVFVELDGTEVPIAELAERLRSGAAIRYRVEFDGENLNVSGRARLNFVQRAQKSEDEKFLRQLTSSDHGRALFDFLKNDTKRRGRPSSFDYASDPSWFVYYSWSQKLADLGDVRIAEGTPANPGPFHGEVDYLLLDDKAESHIWDNLGEYRQYVSGLAGIRVYRDGFGIRVGEDWLGLGGQMTTGKSLYGLRSKNVIGYVSISAKNNRVLKETTSREGFQKTPHYLNFFRLLQEFIKFTEQAQDFMRRGALDYLEAHKQARTGIDKHDVLKSASERLRETARQIDSRGQHLEETRISVSRLVSATKERMRSLTDDAQLAIYQSEKLAQLESLLVDLQSALLTIESNLGRTSEDEGALRKASEILEVVQERDTQLRRELELFYEQVALGITAEALSHEIATISARLARKATTLMGHIAKREPRDRKVLSFVEYVRSSVAALRKQLSRLDPSLRYVRDKRERVCISELLEDTVAFYKDRFDRSGISSTLTVENDLCISINRGKITQVIDNLILNSEYWLGERSRKSQSKGGKIFMEVRAPYLTIWDNGPGVSPSVEESLFDPFVTMKDRGSGRGLGLFIVQQLLNSEGCSAMLLPERNTEGRRFQFRLDLGGAIDSEAGSASVKP